SGRSGPPSRTPRGAWRERAASRSCRASRRWPRRVCRRPASARWSPCSRSSAGRCPAPRPTASRPGRAAAAPGARSPRPSGSSTPHRYLIGRHWKNDGCSFYLFRTPLPPSPWSRRSENVRSGLAPREAVLVDLGVERRSRDPELRRGVGLLPPAFLERPGDHLALDLFRGLPDDVLQLAAHRDADRGIEEVLRLDLVLQVVDGDESVRQRHRAADLVVELADVAGPRIVLQVPEGGLVDVPLRMAGVARDLLQEVL